MDIKVFAQNAIEIIAKGGLRIYIDPFKIESNYNDADVIFITHSHYDHFDINSINNVKNDNTVRKDETKIVVTKDLYDKALSLGFNEKYILIVLPNIESSILGINFSTIPAYNIDKEFHKREYDWVGYILNIDDNVIYVAGDTDITPEAMNVSCDIALVPIGGTYTMTAEEAVKLIEHIKPRRYAIPTHYMTVVGTITDAVTFARLLDGKVDVDIRYN